MKPVACFTDLGLLREGAVRLAEVNPGGMAEETARATAISVGLKTMSARNFGRNLVLPGPPGDRGHWMLDRQKLYLPSAITFEAIAESAANLMRAIKALHGPGLMWWTAQLVFTGDDYEGAAATWRRAVYPGGETFDMSEPPQVVLASYFFHEHAGRRWHEPRNP